MTRPQGVRRADRARARRPGSPPDDSLLATLHVVGGGGVGGVERVAAVLAHGLGERGHSARLVVLGVDGPVSEAAREAGVDVVVVGMTLRRTADPAALLRFLTGLLRLAREVCGRRWDVVQTHLFRTAVLVTPLARLRGCAVVGGLHGIDPSATQRRLMRVLLRHQDAAVCASRPLRDVLVARERFPADRLRVVPNGLAVSGALASVRVGPPSGAVGDDRPGTGEPGFRNTAGIPDDATLVGCIGRLYARKGQRRLLRSFAGVAQQTPQAHLVLAGDGPERGALEADVKRWGLGGRVHMPGELPDTSPLLRALDLLVVPSDYEGFGLVVVEAMLAGVPVVASAAGGPEDLIEDGVTGRLVPVGPDGVDVEALEEAIVESLRDPRARSGWAEAARERASAYLAPAMAEGYERVYRDVLARRRAKRAGSPVSAAARRSARPRGVPRR